MEDISSNRNYPWHWHHLALGHVGIARLADTLRTHFSHPGEKCDPCQRPMNMGWGHGETAQREATMLPWHDVVVDLRTLSIGNQKLKLPALTIIAMVTNLVEVIRIDSAPWLYLCNLLLHWLITTTSSNWHYTSSSLHYGPSKRNNQYETTCWYRRCRCCVGNQVHLQYYIQDHPRRLSLWSRYDPKHPACDGSPAAQRRRRLIDQRLITTNTKRYSYDYNVGDEVLKLRDQPDKLEPRADGPCRVERVHANGTLSIGLQLGVIERISLRRLKPYHRCERFYPTCKVPLL